MTLHVAYKIFSGLDNKTLKEILFHFLVLKALGTRRGEVVMSVQKLLGHFRSNH